MLGIPGITDSQVRLTEFISTAKFLLLCKALDVEAS
jgi:hypothetical protein